MKTIAISCLKGGVGKTSTCLALAAGFYGNGERVLMVDIDGQCNLSFVCGAWNRAPNIRDVLQGSVLASSAVVSSPVGDLLPASAFLSDADIKGANAIKTILRAFSRHYDTVIIDCAPSLGALTVAALFAADFVVVPVKADVLGYNAARQTIATIETAQKRGSKVKLLGILPTMVNQRTTLHKQYLTALEDLTDAHQCRLYAPIRNSTAIAEAESLQQANIFEYAPRAGATMDYQIFFEEIRKGII